VVITYDRRESLRKWATLLASTLALLVTSLRDPEARWDKHLGAESEVLRRLDRDVAAMREASAWLIGRRDFSAFATGRGGVRTVRRADWCADGTLLRFEVAADAFLRGMVRAIVGTLLWVGRGKIDAGRFGEIIASGDRSRAGPSAPANGLCLVAVEYGERTRRIDEDEANE